MQILYLVPYEPSEILKSKFLPIPVLFTEKGCLTSKKEEKVLKLLALKSGIIKNAYEPMGTSSIISGVLS